ncbi:MAG: ankyrin repeat domain-containing protein [Bauldia sp.]|nr:ankyrin repeat domain-containing protein [Bauldia sp.]
MRPTRILGPIIAVLAVAATSSIAAAIDRAAPLAPPDVPAPEMRIAALDDPGIYPRYSREDPIVAYPLHAAALNDDVRLALRLLDRGTLADTRDANGRTPLMVAAAFGNRAVAEVLLAGGANPSARDRLYGDTALHFAALAGRVEVARLLLARGADINTGANMGETPLHYAALYNHRKMIAFLIEGGANIDAADGTGLTPLQYAGKRGRLQARDLLRELGARPDTLLDAVNAGDLTRVRELLRAGVDPNQPELNGTALHLAAVLGRVAIAAALIDAGADLEAEGEPVSSHPLHLAAFHNRLDLVSLLLDRGAQVDARDAEGRTPLIVAALYAGDAALAEVLLANGADPGATDRTLEDPVIHYAAQSGNKAIAGLLLAHGVDVNVRNRRSGAAAIHCAAVMSKLDMVRFLVASGSDLSPVDATGLTPYEQANHHSEFRVMALLRELGAPK